VLSLIATQDEFTEGIKRLLEIVGA
jgi:hypothetical protein